MQSDPVPSLALPSQANPVSGPPVSGRPIPAVLAVVIRQDQVLLVQRANPPDAGLWGFPGGKVDFAEPLLAAAERELAEETGVTAEALRVIDALDAYDRAEDGTIRQHFILVAVLCRWQQGQPCAADDALDARWCPLQGLETGLPLSRDVAALARRAAGLMQQDAVAGEAYGTNPVKNSGGDEGR